MIFYRSVLSLSGVLNVYRELSLFHSLKHTHIPFLPPAYPSSIVVALVKCKCVCVCVSSSFYIYYYYFAIFLLLLFLYNLQQTLYTQYNKNFAVKHAMWHKVTTTTSNERKFNPLSYYMTV